MKNILKNKKGFTLVELLAVIVILALIMSIAVVSMGGIMQSARQSTFKDTALSIIGGVRQQLTLAGEINASYGSTGATYYFEKSILEKGGDKSPLGGDINYITVSSNKAKLDSTATTEATLTKIGTMGVYKSATVTADTACKDTSMSYVKVTYNTTTKVPTFSICLTAGASNPYIFVTDATEAKLQDTNDTSMLKGI